MKIEYRDRRAFIRFCDVPGGDIFMYRGSAFQKYSDAHLSIAEEYRYDHGYVNSIRCDSGHNVKFREDEIVEHRPDAKLIVS